MRKGKTSTILFLQTSLISFASNLCYK